jgi:hypothetical protein
MQRPFSRPFWFAALAAAVFSALLSYTLLWLLKGHLNDMIALCTARNDTCSVASIDRAFQAFCMTEVAATLLLFWLAYKIGRSFIKAVPPTVADAAR